MKIKLLFGKTLFLATLLFTSIYAFAFTVDGINYTITSTSAKEVAVNSNIRASGSITIPSLVRNLNNGITYTVTAIVNYAFTGCTGLTSINLPDSITSIGNYAFSGCTSLASITLPSSITSLGNYAFNSCSSLASVTVNWTTPLDMSASTSAFIGIPGGAKLYVPSNTLSAYQNADIWKDYFTIVESTLATTDFNKEKEKVFFDGSSNTLKLAAAKPFGEYEVYDTTGRTILKGNAKSGEISLNTIPKGIYILRAKNLASAVKFRK